MSPTSTHTSQNLRGNGREHPEDPHDPCNNAISDCTALGISREAYANAAVNHAHSDEDATEPHVDVGPEGSSSSAAEGGMVESS